MTRKELLFKMKPYPKFYRDVWEACLAIKAGETRSYKWLAQRIGRPRAARAVALALKRNPFAPLVPCHRVVRCDGSLGGYSGPGGAAAKKRLLRAEGALTTASYWRARNRSWLGHGDIVLLKRGGR